MFRYMVLGLILAVGWMQSPTQSRQAEVERLRKPSAYSGLPIVGEFQENQVEAAPDRERRQTREKRYNKTNQPRQVEDVGLFVNGEAETINLRFIDYVVVGKSTDPQGIPVSVATAVVIGTVLSGKCFVSGDHTYVYTDYRVRVEQVLKQDQETSLSVGHELVGAREGGAVHFPSGHVTNFLTQGHGLPEIGSQYVLFLSRPIPTLPEYEIMFDAGYQLKGGRVYPLDDVNSPYVGVDAGGFLEDVQKAINSSKSGGVKP